MNPTPSNSPTGARRIRNMLMRGAGAAFLINVVGVGAMYASHVLLANWMGGEKEYGAYALAFTWAQMLGFIAGLGLPVAALRFIPEYLDRNDAAHLHGFLRASCAVSLVVGLVLAGVGTGITKLIAPAHLQPAILLGLWLSPLVSVSHVQKETARGARRIALSLAPTQIVLPLATTLAALAIFLWTGSLSSNEALAALAGASIVVLIIQQVGLKFVLPARGDAPVKMDWRFWMAVALPLLLVQESLVILRQTDIVMIGFFEADDTGQVGRYSAAVRTAMLARFLLLAMNMIAAPMIASFHARQDHQGMQYMVQTATRWIFWPSAAIAVMICLLAKPALNLFGDGFTEASTALCILVLGQLVSASFGPVGHLLKLTGHHYKSLRVYGSSVVINIGLNAALIPTIGIEGAAIATTVTIIMRNIWAYTLVRRHLDIHCFAFFRAKQKAD